MHSNLTFSSAITVPRYLPSPDSNSYTRCTNIDNHLLRPLQKRSKESSGHFTAALAHELRNPLANIKLSVEMLESSIKDEQLQVFLDIITRSSTRINDLINKLVNYNQDEVRAEKCSIHQLLDEVLELAKDRFRLKKIMVLKNYKQDCEMILNRGEMKIAFTNIIINAIDAMAAGKGQLKLVTKLSEGKYVVLIRDNGCGISRKNLESIFKPYFTNKPGGLGIGLTATYNLLRSNNVSVSVESKEKKGTQFKLSFGNNV